MYKNCHNNKIVIYDDTPKRHDKALLYKTMAMLKDKYRNLIRERNFDMIWFRQRVIKEIRKVTYYVLPDYDSFFKKIEKIFLKEISNCCNLENNGILTPPSVHDMLIVNNYKYSVHFPVGKVTLRNLIEYEPRYAPVDKYLNLRNRGRAMSKTERRIDYSKKLLNNLPQTNYYY